MATSLDEDQVIPQFEHLEGVDGGSYSVSDFDEREILVIVFMGNGCPTCKATEERLITLQTEYGPRGVQILLVNSNNQHISPPDTLGEMRRRSDESHYNFPYVKDPTANLAKSLGAKTTPHAFVFDRARKLRYQGRVDNARQKALVTVEDVRNAIEDLLAGSEVRTKKTTSFGCSIIW